MTHIIRLENGVEVENFSCSVGFTVEVLYFSGNDNVALTNLSLSPVPVTHSTLFRMLQEADNVNEINNVDSKEVAILDMGNGVSIKVWKK